MNAVGWQQRLFGEPARGEWVDWVSGELIWWFPPSLITRGGVNSDDAAVGQTAIVIPRSAVRSLYDLDITVEFMPDPALSCDRHQPPAFRTFPYSHDGVTVLLAQLDDIETRVVEAAEICACPDCIAVGKKALAEPWARFGV